MLPTTLLTAEQLQLVDRTVASQGLCTYSLIPRAGYLSYRGTFADRLRQ